MPDYPGFEKMKLEYTALRTEIVQSISYQHQILLAGYGATGAFVSYVVGKSPSPNLPALIIVPFILLGMTSLWIVECNRMVRASYYIGRILWRCLREEPMEWPRNDHWQSAEWECWIRSKTGVASRFRERQHRSQCMVVLWGPLFLTVVASAAATYGAFTSAELNTLLKGSIPWVIIGLGITAIVFWLRIHMDLREISDVGEIQIPDSPVDDVTEGAA